MLNVSDEFLSVMNESRAFEYEVRLTLADTWWKPMTLTEDDLLLEGCRITNSPGSSSFPVGNAICKMLTLEILNDDGAFDDIDFYNARISVSLSLQLSQDKETISLGNYTVITPVTRGNVIELTAYDDMFKADKPYERYFLLTFPTTARILYRTVCANIGLDYLTDSFPNQDLIIKEPPEDMTYREVLGLIAMYAGGNAIMKGRGVLIRPYTSAGTEYANYSGGVFDEGTPYYETGDNLLGGHFNPWDDPVQVFSGTFADTDASHYLADHEDIEIGNDLITITGIVADEDGEEYVVGTKDYALKIDQLLPTDAPEAIIDAIADRLIGLKFRTFDVSEFSYPLAEIGDPVALVDAKGRRYTSFITDIDFVFKGFTQISCTAESPLRTQAVQPASQVVKEVVREQIAAYDTETQRMFDLIANSAGMFTTKETHFSGATIYYMHDASTLEKSTTIWRYTSGGFMVSTDGGKTWNAGMDSSGNAVVNVLSAVGINADWINAGTIKGRTLIGNRIVGNYVSGSEITVGGAEDEIEGTDGKLYIKDGNNNILATFDKSGAVFEKDGVIKIKGTSTWTSLTAQTEMRLTDGSLRTFADGIEVLNVGVNRSFGKVHAGITGMDVLDFGLYSNYAARTYNAYFGAYGPNIGVPYATLLRGHTRLTLPSDQGITIPDGSPVESFTGGCYRFGPLIIYDITITLPSNVRYTDVKDTTYIALEGLVVPSFSCKAGALDSAAETRIYLYRRNAEDEMYTKGPPIEAYVRMGLQGLYIHHCWAPDDPYVVSGAQRFYGYAVTVPI